MNGDSVIPPPLEDDDDDVAWALQTAAVQWNRGAFTEAVTWVRRAVEAAITAGSPKRIKELNRLAEDVAERAKDAALAAEDDAEEIEEIEEIDEVDEVDAAPKASPSMRPAFPPPRPAGKPPRPPRPPRPPPRPSVRRDMPTEPELGEPESTAEPPRDEAAAAPASADDAVTAVQDVIPSEAPASDPTPPSVEDPTDSIRRSLMQSDPPPPLADEEGDLASLPIGAGGDDATIEMPASASSVPSSTLPPTDDDTTTEMRLADIMGVGQAVVEARRSSAPAPADAAPDGAMPSGSNAPSAMDVTDAPTTEPPDAAADDGDESSAASEGAGDAADVSAPATPPPLADAVSGADAPELDESPVSVPGRSEPPDAAEDVDALLAATPVPGFPPSEPPPLDSAPSESEPAAGAPGSEPPPLDSAPSEPPPLDSAPSEPATPSEPALHASAEPAALDSTTSEPPATGIGIEGVGALLAETLAAEGIDSSVPPGAHAGLTSSIADSVAEELASSPGGLDFDSEPNAAAPPSSEPRGSEPPDSDEALDLLSDSELPPSDEMVPGGVDAPLPAGIPEEAASAPPAADGGPSSDPGRPAVDGVFLDEVRGFEDLPEEAQVELARVAEVQTLNLEEEVGSFGAALVTRGAVGIMPAIADVAASVARPGDVVFTAGTLEDGILLRVVALEDDTAVASWKTDALDAAFADCPWVADELREVADRFQALAGCTLGELGDRLDDSLRAAVTDRLQVRALETGDIIVEKGAAVPGLHIVGAGRLELLDGDEIIDELGPGDFVFPSAITRAGAAPATVRVGKGGALVLHASRTDAHELMLSVPPLLEILAG